MALPVGTMIRGRYLVQGQLGKGGFGAVYLVKDQHVKRDDLNLFVLKEVIIPSKHRLHQIFLEGMALRLLRHQALPRVYKVLSDNKQDRVYILMDYIEGRNLRMLRRGQPESRFSFLQAMTIMTPIMQAVAYLHSDLPPIIHQDIKPVNIIVHRGGLGPGGHSDRAVLVDIGGSKKYNLCLARTDVQPPLSGYEAPEQCDGKADERTDIYALGATFYTLLTDIVPPDALYREKQVASTGIDPLEPVDKLVTAISRLVASSIYQAMSLRMDDRFSTVQQFERALKTDPTWLQSPKLDLRLVTQELEYALKATQVNQEPPEPMIPPTAAAQSRTNLVKQMSPEPFIVPSLPTDQRPPEPEVVPPALVEQEPPEPEVVPPALVEQELTIAYEAPSDAIDQQPLVADVIPSAPTQSPVIPEEAEEIPAAESMTVQPRTIRSSKLGVLLPLSVVILIGIILGVVFLFVLVNPGSHSATPTSVVLHKTTPQSSPGPPMTSTPIQSSTTTANISGSYKGTIYSILANVTTTMSLAGIQQSQGNISGYFTGLRVSGSLIGIVDATRHIQFTVMNSAGHPILSFDGAIQSDGNFSGSYCSLDQKRQCSGDYGIWSVGPASASQLSLFIFSPGTRAASLAPRHSPVM